MSQFEKATTTKVQNSTQQFEKYTKDLKSEVNILKVELNEASKTVGEFKEIRFKLET
jgi:hypothetical protein